MNTDTGHPRPPAGETLDPHGAHPRLTALQIATLVRDGERRVTREGDVLLREGEPCKEFIVVLSGTVEIIHDYGGPEERVIARHGPGRFLGELGLLEGQVAFDTAVVAKPGAVLAVPLERQRDLVARDPVLGDLVLRAYLGRRSLLIGLGAGFRILGSAYSPDTLRLREFAARNRLPHRWTDLEKDQEAEEVLHRFGIRPDETPVVIWNGRKVLRHPSPADLASLIGLPHSRLTDLTCDLLVIGTGPAGLATAVYGASDGLLTVAVDATATGGQAGMSSRIENYLGFPSGISGGELIERSVLQARKFGARITVPAEATGLEQRDGHYTVSFADGSETATDTVVVAAGVRYRKLEADGIGGLEGISIHYAATLHEANLCRDDPVAVVGGGNSAGQAALFLAGHAPEVYLLVRSGDLGKDMSRYLVDQLERHPKVEILTHTEVRQVHGADVLRSLNIEDNRTGRRRELAARALFVFIGTRPHTQWLQDTIALDSQGFVLTGSDAESVADEKTWLPLGRRPQLLETTLPGVFAAGDVRSGSVKRVTSAAGEGATAVRLVHEHRARTDIPEDPSTPPPRSRSDIRARIQRARHSGS
ncbi:FAD-dependent oxidoreductase [Streptomyces sp. NPDC006645]|uniref:FAD-dependent oxidoreductase n=1 Tax=unclassified Streptomyces TaxID=2593676 RepID=UPI0033AD9635